MKLKYPIADRQMVLDLCMAENEHQFFLGVRMNDGMLEYAGMPIIAEGEKYQGNGNVYTVAYMKRHMLKEQGIFLLEGHTHPMPEGGKIPPAYAGWTIGRTRELRDYRNERLLEMPGGKGYLEWRKTKIDEYLKLDTKSPERDGIRMEVIEKSLWFSSANLIEKNGVCFTITNRLEGADDMVVDDITAQKESFGGDTVAFLCMKRFLDEVPIVDYAILAKPKKDAVNTPSSRDKFEIIAMKYNPDVFASFEGIDIIE